MKDTITRMEVQKATCDPKSVNWECGSWKNRKTVFLKKKARISSKINSVFQLCLKCISVREKAD
jgi:hypothetical protein